MHILIYLASVFVLLLTALRDHKTRILPALYWWALFMIAIVNGMIEPWVVVDLVLFATVTMLGAAFWWLGVMGQGDILVLVATAAISPGISISYMAWSVTALAGMIPAFLYYNVKQHKGMGVVNDFRSMMTAPVNPMLPFLCIGFVVAPVITGSLKY